MKTILCIFRFEIRSHSNDHTIQTTSSDKPEPLPSEVESGDRNESGSEGESESGGKGRGENDDGGPLPQDWG